MSKEKNTFKIKEALVKDAGRAVARIDPEDIKQLGLELGDIVLIKGKTSSPAKIMPCYPEDRNKGIIQIDGIIRENIGAGIDENAGISKVSAQQAARIKLKPLGGAGTLNKSRDTQYVGSLINGLPVVAGDKIRATLFGSRTVDYSVVETAPDGVVMIGPDTTIKLEAAQKSEKASSKVSYEDIGGLSEQVHRVREMIELPLRYPEVIDRLGIEPPKGVFLYGPPGTGKTLIVRAVANETDAYFVSISGAEIMGKFYGESESRIRKIFEQAQANAPAIIFIDEIDAIAQKREDMGGEKQVEKRVVAQLLSLMDGMEARGKVIVIGATNIPNTIDPALRRPGRFDREIGIPIPDKKSRLKVLQIHTRGMPIAENVNLEALAEITHGFVGADLEALAREAAMIALRKIIPQIDFNLKSIPYKMLMELEIDWDNFKDAMKKVEPSAIREVFVEVPDVKWSEVGGLDNIKEAVKEAVEWPLKYPALFKKADTKPPKGVVLYGKPGTGKTYLAKALATESGVNFISVKGPQLISRYIGESERGVRELFRKAKQAAPAIIFIDEIDSLTPQRSGNNSGGVTERVISQFLTEMDGIEDLKDVFVLAATNRIDLVDPALLRKGRFDLKFRLSEPDLPTREAIFRIHTKNKPVDNGIDMAALARDTEGMVGADIEFICNKAAMVAIREYIASHKKVDEAKADDFVIRKTHFNTALQETYTLSLQKDDEEG